MRVLVTGSDGFIGRNLMVALKELKDVEIFGFTENSTEEDLISALQQVDFIFHLAGVNRPKEIKEFVEGNAGFTDTLCQTIISLGKKTPILFTSSTQVELDNPYGISKLSSEKVLLDYGKTTGAQVCIFRLPNVFGKWCRPNYNSVVATFCYNILNDMPIKINDPNAIVNLVYVDDVVKKFIETMSLMPAKVKCEITPVYSITVGDLAKQISKFKEGRKTLITENVGNGLIRALYSTYMSYMEPRQFTYLLSKHEDSRGVFVEVLKTLNAGQFSYFTAYPGITRGGHYHHTKTEKFLVIRGKARFCYRHIITDQKYECYVSGDKPEVVETVPGWAHDITNIGDDEMIVLLWGNEVFDKEHPDTIAGSVT